MLAPNQAPLPIAPQQQPQQQHKPAAQNKGALFSGIEALFGHGQDSHPQPPGKNGHQAGATASKAAPLYGHYADDRAPQHKAAAKDDGASKGNEGLTISLDQLQRSGHGARQTTDARSLWGSFGEKGWAGSSSRTLTSGTGDKKTVDSRQLGASKDDDGLHFNWNKALRTGQGSKQTTDAKSTTASIGWAGAVFKRDSSHESGEGKEQRSDSKSTTASASKEGVSFKRENGRESGEGKDHKAENNATTVSAGPDGVSFKRENGRESGEGKDHKADSNATTVSAGPDGVGIGRENTRKKGAGKDQTVDSTATTAHAGPDGVKIGRDSSRTTGEGKDAKTDSTATNVSAGPDGVGVGRNSSQKTGDDQNGTARSSNVNASLGPDGVMVGGGRENSKTKDGKTTSTSTHASIGVFPGGEDGPSASAAASYSHNDLSVGGSAKLTKDTTELGANAAFKKVEVSAKYEHVHGKMATIENSAPDANDDVGQLINGHGYVGAKRSNSTAVQVSAGVQGVASVSGGVQSGNSLEVFDKTPARWDKMSQKEKDGYQKKEESRLKKTGGLADVDVAHLPEGSGVSFNSYNGWNAGGSISYGSVGLDGSHSQTSEHQVSMARTGDFVKVSMTRQDGVDNKLGMHMAGLSLSGEQQKSNSHRFQFQVDVHNPKALASVQEFMKTGLLPGADKLKGAGPQAAAAKLGDAKTQVDTLSGQIDKLNAKLKNASKKPGENPAAGDAMKDQQALQQLKGQLNSAQQKFELNRNYLNDTWQEQLGVGNESMPGVKMESKTHTQEEDTRASLGIPGLFSVGLGGTQKTKIDKDYLDGSGKAQSSFAYAQRNTGFMNKFKGEQSTQTNTDQSGVLWRMDSNNDLDLKHNADIVKSIANRDVPDYELDTQYHHRVSGETHIALTQQQMTAMSTNMNDMSNPQSQAMWKDFSVRTSELFSSKDGHKPTMGSYGRGAAMYAQQSPGDKFIHDIKDKGKDDPMYKALTSFGVDPDHTSGDAMKKVSQELSSIKSPDDFQQLKPDQQLLFVKMLKDTSGHDKDPSGKRNSYEAVAAISLMKDPKVVAEQERSAFQDANNQARNDHRDGTVEFVRFAERFKDDPATFSTLQKSMSFEWHSDQWDKHKKDDANQLQKDLNGALNKKSGNFLSGTHHGIDAGDTSGVLIAAQKKGGPELVKKLISDSGMNPREVLEKFHDDPTGQHLFYDMMTADGYGQQLKGAKLDFTPTPAAATDSGSCTP